MLIENSPDLIVLVGDMEKVLFASIEIVLILTRVVATVTAIEIKLKRALTTSRLCGPIQ